MINRRPAEMRYKQTNENDQVWKRIKAKEKRLPAIYQRFGEEVKAAHDALVKKKNYDWVWFHLERAHILSQDSPSRHLAIHMVMMLVAFMQRNIREILAQVPRIILAVPASIMKKSPVGNTGRSNMSIFAEKPLPKDLENILLQRKAEFISLKSKMRL